ncbi:hypothetical protein [Insolitispirillum peregrinum]|uniref:Uncharacterized protein n=1 Tax=Insolitispirillum peregrinum TaxID=80876 RepID=A0A1N7MHM1_9PROT|nr:hypothetical protein [Insolitispirillum peregrinum]SIS85550.1 hypothetical protein SAMN05421779_104126 [Insolitispirillum peregrinum]
MKARAAVFTHTQLPLTLFGLPPRLTMVLLVLCGAPFALLFVLGWTKTGYVGMLGGSIAALVLAFRIGRADPHIESVWLTSGAFWRRRPARTLIAGSPDQEAR